jgi:hypothetical protein
VFFFDTFTGELLGTWALPRSQPAVENCTIHNSNVVSTGKRDVLVMGNYQAGTWVVDFTNPRHTRTVAWSDPPPLDPGSLTLGGAWGSYNGFCGSSGRGPWGIAVRLRRPASRHDSQRFRRPLGLPW